MDTETEGGRRMPWRVVEQRQRRRVARDRDLRTALLLGVLLGGFGLWGIAWSMWRLTDTPTWAVFAAVTGALVAFLSWLGRRTVGGLDDREFDEFDEQAARLAPWRQR